MSWSSTTCGLYRLKVWARVVNTPGWVRWRRTYDLQMRLRALLLSGMSKRDMGRNIW